MEPTTGADEPADGPGSARGRLSGHRILIVDDEPAMIVLLTATLEGEGAEVLAAYDAEEALRMMAEEPSLAVVDVNLGAVSGFELVEEIRRISHVPVILLTGRAAEEDAVTGLAVGADDYMRKPFSPIELVARIQARLRRP